MKRRSAMAKCKLCGIIMITNGDYEADFCSDFCENEYYEDGRDRDINNRIDRLLGK